MTDADSMLVSNIASTLKEARRLLARIESLIYEQAEISQQEATVLAAQCGTAKALLGSLDKECSSKNVGCHLILDLAALIERYDEAEGYFKEIRNDLKLQTTLS